MRNTSQYLLPLAYDRKLDNQVATDHLVRASVAVNTIIDTVRNNGNIDSMEFDCEISHTWAIRVVMNGGTASVSIEEHCIKTDNLINTSIDLEVKTLMQWLEEIVHKPLMEAVATYRYERAEYANENDGY